MLTRRLAVLWVALAALLATTPPSAGQPPATTPPSAGQPPATTSPSAGQPPATTSPSAGQPPATTSPSAGQPRTPAPTPVVIDIEGSPSLGPENAPVTIVEFGDFQCPYCAQGAKTLRRYIENYPDRVRWVFKHYPLRTLHPKAALAHEAAVAAQEQGKFWEMHELIMRNQANVRYADLVGYAEQIGLDMAAFKDALDTRRLRPRVIRDMDEARRLAVTGTPTYFVNGHRHMGAPTPAGLRALVDGFIRRPSAAPAGAAGSPPATAPTGAADSPSSTPGSAPGAAAPR